MDKIVNWIKGIAIFYIAASLLLNIVPEGKYRKYIKTFLGFLMIILMVKPLGDLFNASDSFKNSLKINSNIQMSDELKSQVKMAGESRKETVIGAYKDEMIKGMQNEMNEYDINIDDLQVNTDDEGNITKMTLYVTRKDSGVKDKQSDNLLKIQIKNYISDFYNLKERNIYVNISD